MSDDLLAAADLHNTGNGNPSFWSNPVDSSVDAVKNAGYAVAATAVSGVNGLWNTGASVGNFFGADLPVDSAHAWMGNIDSDLDGYYMQHQQGIDTAGFLLGSFAPGLAGVKIADAGMLALRGALSGFTGETASLATGLLPPLLDTFRKSAAFDIAVGTEKFSLINQNVLKAIGAGLLQNTYEAGAFSTFSTLAQYQSPVLQGQDAGSIAKDILTSSLEFGAVGGIFSAAKTFYGIKNAAGAVDKVVNTRFDVPEFTKLTAGEQAVNYGTQLQNLAQAPSVEDIVTGKVPGLAKVFEPAASIDEATGQQMEQAQALVQKFQTARARVVSQLTDALSGKITELAGGDSELGRLVINGTLGVGNGADGLLDSTKIMRLGQEPETAAAASRVKAGTQYSNYVQLFGDDAGTQSFTKPEQWRVADIEPSVAKVNDFVAKQKFSLDKPVDYTQFGSMDELTANARNIWAAGLKSIPEGTVVNEYDVPLLKRALELNTPVLVKASDGVVDRLLPQQLMGQIQSSVQDIKQAAAAKFLGGEPAVSMDQLAHRLDVSRDYLEGTQSKNIADDLYNSRTESKAYTQKLVDSGVLPTGTAPIDTAVLPKFAAIQNLQRPVSAYGTPNEFIVSAQASVLARAKIAADIAKLKLFDVLGNDVNNLAPLDTRTVTRYGVGGGFFSKPNENYGTAGSVAQHSGFVTERGIARVTDAIKSTMLPDADAVRTGWLSPEERMSGSTVMPAAEVSAVLARAQKAGEQYIPFTLDDGTSGFALRSVVDELNKGDYIDTPRTAQSLGDVAQGIQTRRVGVDAFIPVESDGAYNLLQTHIGLSDQWLQKQISLDASRGIDSTEKFSDLMGGLYIPKPNPNRFPFFATVTDERLGAGGAGRTTMIHAPTEKALIQLMDRVKSETGFVVRTRDEAERFFKGQGLFDYEQTMNSSYVDQDLQSKGLMTPHFVQTDPNAVVDDLLSFHVNRAAQQYREGVSSFYQDEFAKIGNVEQVYTDAARSTSNSNRPAQATGPGADMIRTALGLPKFSPLWNGIDDAINNSARGMLDTIKKATATAQTPADLDAINAVLDRHGVQTAYQDAALYALVNHPAGVKPVTRFVRATNAAMSTLVLGWDALNGVNNALGATILRSGELQNVLDGIRQVNPDAVGKLAEVSSDGVSMLSPVKMQIAALKDWFSSDKTDPLYQRFKAAGYIKDAHEVQMALINDATLNGTESVADLAAKQDSMIKNSSLLARLDNGVSAVGDFGRTWTGNNYMERLNRYMSAHVATQITDVAQAQGVLSPQEAQTIITTFMNRTEGTLAASQRPTVFQGAIGSAVSLFQSYQFNMMQQLMRYVGDGQSKALAYALGMQSTMYGMNGMPGFQQMNQHIIGTLSTNPQHRDAYDTAVGAAGKGLGDILLYGIPSNIMQTNLYSRGDINPRYATVLPTSLADIPVVTMFQKAIALAQNVGQEAAGTGNITHAILTGLEENGVNRPIAGLAMLTKGLVYNNGKVIATSGQGVGNVSSELYSLSQLARLAGGRPLDEATALDGLYRIAAFNKADADQKQTLTENLRNAAAAGNVSPGLVNDSVNWFVTHGKTQKDFNSWMLDTQKGMQQDQVDKVAANLKAPYAYKMQLIMGGAPSQVQVAMPQPQDQQNQQNETNGGTQ